MLSRADRLIYQALNEGDPIVGERVRKRDLYTQGNIPLPSTPDINKKSTYGELKALSRSSSGVVKAYDTGAERKVVPYYKQEFKLIPTPSGAPTPAPGHPSSDWYNISRSAPGVRAGSSTSVRRPY